MASVAAGAPAGCKYSVRPSGSDGRRKLKAINTLYGRVLRGLVDLKPHDLRRQVQFLKAEIEISTSSVGVGPVPRRAEQHYRLA